MEPPWKSLSVIVVTAFFFDMTAAEVEPAGAGDGRLLPLSPKGGALDRGLAPQAFQVQVCVALPVGGKCLMGWVGNFALWRSTLWVTRVLCIQIER